MSLITAFPFHAYVGDLKTRAVQESKQGVSLSLLTPEDMSRIAFVEVRTRCGQEDRLAPWRPVVRNGEEFPTFYDPRMGNFDVRTFPPHSCMTCATSLTGKYGNERCQGHFGFIGMPRLFPGDALRGTERMYVMNPHLAEEVEHLLQSACFFCHRFRAPLFDVERYRQALRLIDSGLIGEALHLLDVVSNARGHDTRVRRLCTANEEIVNDVTLLNEHVERILRHHAILSAEGTAVKTSHTGKGAFDVRNEVARQALRDLKEFTNVCSHCRAISPRITKRNGHFFFFFRKNTLAMNVTNKFLSQTQIQEWEESNRLHRRTHTYLSNTDIREHLKQLCQHEEALLALLFPHLGEPSVQTPHTTPVAARNMYRVFFIDRILVPPMPLRLSNGAQIQDNGVISPDSQTRALSDVLGFVEQIECYQTLLNNSTPDRQLLSSAQELANEINLRNLQLKVNEVYADVMGTFAKKEGLFRMNMMGKRVNQACRSVISPDPLVEPNEVLLPRPFSRSLSFPEQVTYYAPARMDLLRRCVVNGPQRYPGATHLEIRHPNGEVRFVDLNVSEPTRRQHAAKYFALAQSNVTLIVFRHILDGDRVVFNRQPTLHKPSMMGYRVKVLSGYKTIRFHYVNGSSFNADFDGDEMNIHVPQSLEAKAELDCLMDANLNYLVPTSGKPIRGLIQDHVAAGVLLTLRDKFLDHGTFVQLVYYGLAPYMRQQTQKHQMTLTRMIPIPAILAPRPLWTGKQLISVVVRFVTGGDPRREYGEGATLRGTSLIQPSSYNHTAVGDSAVTNVTRGAFDDDGVLFMNSELLVGLMCKKQLGASSMSVAHIVHEMYGPHKVGQLFGALGRILTLSLQREGFSMGMDDMCLVQEQRRYELLRQLDEAPLQFADDEATAMSKIMEHATKLQQEFMPGRMLVPFPRNQLLTMTQSGAKGSNANATQMALGLGQQLFDGRRVKRMNSGKTLPAFFAHERRARSFGYAIGRFASGIRPPEYTIHAMAGRDGLIDTAVKTSRSGHLQRCLIKGLESLVVHWDHSVRDSNGDVLQFIYGGDGLDPCKASTLTAWEMAKENLTDLRERFVLDKDTLQGKDDGKNEAEVAQNGSKRPREAEANEKETAEEAHATRLAHENPLPRHLHQALDGYLNNKANYTLFRKLSQLARWVTPERVHEKLQQRRRESVEYYNESLTDLTAARRLRAFCDAGEPVGLLAAQAAGEPSTQMTLNTFHSAGSTVTHVTEGIPRLRELLIHASVHSAAVVVPVVGAQKEDEAAIATLLRAGVATRLQDCLAHSDDRNGKGYHYHVTRRADATILTVALLFSKPELEESGAAMCMSPGEHLDSFTDALRQFGRRVVTGLRGRTREAKGGASTSDGGGVGGTAMDAATSGAAPAAEMDERGSVDDGMMSDEDENEDEDEEGLGSHGGALGDNEVGNGYANSFPSASPALRSQRDPHEHPDAGLDDSEGDDEDGDENDGRDAKENDEGEDEDEDDLDNENEEEEAAASGNRPNRGRRHGQDDNGSNGDANGVSKREKLDKFTHNYTNFHTIRASFGGKLFTVEIAPLSPAAAARGGVVSLPDSLFIVNMVVCMPPHIIAVIPDVLDGALAQQTLPSWLPQFGSVSFTRKAEEPSSGELVFQGANATLRHVLSFLSLFTVRARAIKLCSARSTDIRDMANWFGVESANKALYDELSKLFKRYSVDHRHLTLIADAATQRGMWENFNFTGVISHSASPLFQMTFASSKRWLHTAVSRGLCDDLKSISSAIMVGERPKVGTACVKVVQDASILRDVVERHFA